MISPTASARPSFAELVLEAELTVIRCLHAAAVQDPFWESITVRHEGPEATLTVVNLVEYEPHTRSRSAFGAELLSAVQREVELLRQCRTANDDLTVTVNPVLVTVYRDSVTSGGDPAPLPTALAA